MNEVYLDTARLLTQLAPFVFADNTFALKGGTAINLFVRDMPRLSVDLDLVFPDHGMPRDQALAAIGEALQQSAERPRTRGFQTRMQPAADASETKLLALALLLSASTTADFSDSQAAFGSGSSSAWCGCRADSQAA
jgi:hypothetical protein